MIEGERQKMVFVKESEKMVFVRGRERRLSICPCS